MRITHRIWHEYTARLRRISERAEKEMSAKMFQLGNLYNEKKITLEEYEDALIDYAYALATKYGEGAAAAACEMYDAVAELQKASVPPAIPAETATISETAKMVKGTLKTGNPAITAQVT